MIEMQFLLEFRISKETGGGLPGENRENQNQEETKKEPIENQREPMKSRNRENQNQEDTKKEPGENQREPMKSRKRSGSENVMKVDGFR